MGYYRRLRDLREDNDKTQKDVADYLGTCYQYYAVYEKGKSELSFERAIMLAKYYNVSLDYIAELTDCKQIGGAKNELTKKYDKLTPRGKLIINNLIDELLENNKSK